MRWNSINGCDYGFVQLTNAGSANEALLQPVQTWDHATLRIAVAHKHFQPGSKNINILNDDCLKHVFGHLEITAIATVVNVCVRFKERAQKSLASMQSANVKNQSALYLVTNFCSTTQLKELVLENITLNKESVQLLSPFFATLKKLHIVKCEFSAESEDALPTTMVLEELRFLSSRMMFANKMLELNPNLKKLAIEVYQMMDLAKTIVDQSIEELEICANHFEQFYSVLENLQLKQIKILKLLCPRFNEALELFLVSDIFPELHTLHLRCTYVSLTYGMLTLLLSNSKKLSIFELTSNYIKIDFPVHGYDEILQVIQGRQENKSVLINFKCCRYDGIYPKKKMIKNPNYLNIKMTTIDEFTF